MFHFSPFMLAAFLRDKNVGSVAATSEYCVRKIIDQIDFKPCQVIVEYGPGNGAFTKVLLQRLQQDSMVIAIETNEEFVRELNETLGKEYPPTKFKVIHDSAEHVEEILTGLGIQSIDYVISGIPFSFLGLHAKEQIVRDTEKLLKPEGRFLIYQALVAVRARRLTKKIVSGRFEIEQEKALLPNIPPLYFLDAAPRRRDSSHESNRPAM